MRGTRFRDILNDVLRVRCFATRKARARLLLRAVGIWRAFHIVVKGLERDRGQFYRDSPCFWPSQMCCSLWVQMCHADVDKQFPRALIHRLFVVHFWRKKGLEDVMIPRLEGLPVTESTLKLRLHLFLSRKGNRVSYYGFYDLTGIKHNPQSPHTL